MRVLVTGSTGFVGRHVVRALLDRGHSVTAVGRDTMRASTFDWYGRVNFVAADIHADYDAPAARFGPADVVMHLAWPGLPNYKELFHFEESLPRDYGFLKSLVVAGYRRLLVTGTCLECGMRDGALSESAEARPMVPYTLAKATLRAFLETLQTRQSFDLQWARLFYMYGEGQNPKALLSQLDRAIDAGADHFDMSGGEQLRDYLPVAEVAAKLVSLAEHPEWDGVTNICSGKPISVRSLAERHVAARGASIKLNFGVYPYPDYEPMAFWGTSSRAL